MNLVEHHADIERVDHLAEHYATTGSDVCWCDFPECARREGGGPMNLVGNLIALPGPLLDDGLAWMLAVECRAEAREMEWRS